MKVCMKVCVCVCVCVCVELLYCGPVLAVHSGAAASWKKVSEWVSECEEERVEAAAAAAAAAAVAAAAADM